MIFLEFPLFGSSFKLKKTEKSEKITLGKSWRANLRNSPKLILSFLIIIIISYQFFLRVGFEPPARTTRPHQSSPRELINKPSWRKEVGVQLHGEK